MNSKVYWFGPRSPPGYVVKGQRIFEEAELFKCFEKGDSVAIKIHCGDYNNTGHLRPNIVAGIVEKVKEYGGEPFVTDTTTLLYWPFAGRTQAQHEYKTAARNGFTEATLGCPFIVADGDSGLDDVKVEIDGHFLQATYIASSIANADAMISLVHFKGHDMGVYGGAIKNLGIGCCSKRGKAATHMLTHPSLGYSFFPEKCKGEDCPVYETCIEFCPIDGAFEVVKEKPHARWDLEKCVGCGGVWFRCACGVLQYPPNGEIIYPAVMADSAAAVVKVLGKEHIGFINFAIDVKPFCDCGSAVDSDILPDLGVYASRDMVAVDAACLEAADQAEGIRGSALFDKGIVGEPWKPGEEKFTSIVRSFVRRSLVPKEMQEFSQWIQVNAAARLGLGLPQYELVEAEFEDLTRYYPPWLGGKTVASKIKKKLEMTSMKPDPDVYRQVPKLSEDELKGLNQKPM